MSRHTGHGTKKKRSRIPTHTAASAPQRWCRSKVSICVSVSTSRFMASVVVYFASKMILRPPSNVP